MKLEQALDLLDLERLPEEKDVLHDLIEEAVFPIREYFLRQPVVAVLFRSRIARIQQLQEASRTFELTYAEPEPLANITFDQRELPALLRAYESEMSQARLEVARHLSPPQVIQAAQHMVSVQSAFEVSFLSVTAEFASAEADILAAQLLDTGKALRLLSEAPQEVQSLIENERKRIALIHARARQS